MEDWNKYLGYFLLYKSVKACNINYLGIVLGHTKTDFCPTQVCEAKTEKRQKRACAPTLQMIDKQYQ